MNAKKYPISIASYSFNKLLSDGRTNIFAYLEDLKYRYNVDYADIWSGYITPGWGNYDLDMDFMKKIRFSMDEKGIALANLCVDGPHLWWDAEDDRKKHYEGAFAYMKAAVVLGAKTVRIDVGVREDTISDEQFDYVAKTYSDLAKFAKENNMRVGTENHWGASRDPQVLERIYKAVNNDAYGHLFHFGNFIDGQIDAGLETVLKMAMHTHIPANYFPFAKEYMRRLVNAGYKGAFSIEHHSGKHEYERVAWQVATVRALLTELEDEGFDNPAAPDYFSEIYAGKK